MADYYPLLARAVTGLQSSTLEARQAIYDRARDALLGQLRGITPALPDQDIERESKALDAAVKRLEDELAVGAARRRRAGKTVDPSDDVEAVLASDPRPDTKPAARPALRDRRLEPDRENGAGAEGDALNRRTGNDRRRAEPMHPAAPTPQIPRQSKARIWIVGATIVAVVAMIGLTAYFLREGPEDLARSKPSQAVGAPVTSAGKITGRIGGDGQAAASNPVPAVPVAVVPIEVPKAPAGSSPDPGSPKTTPAAPVKGAAAAGQTLPAAPGETKDAGARNSDPASQAKSTPTIPVAYRAALLVQAEKSTDHKTYVGTVIWRLDSITGDPGQPLQAALRAEIDIPEAKLKVSLQMQKNTDPALSASHTLVLGFVPGPDGAFKGVRSIQMPQMRDESSPNGEALIGIGIVPITPTYFLVGLQQGEQNVARNFALLTSHNWMDVQFVLDDGRAAKITFEEGAQGQQLMKEAMAAWK